MANRCRIMRWIGNMAVGRCGIISGQIATFLLSALSTFGMASLSWKSAESLLHDFAREYVQLTVLLLSHFSNLKRSRFVAGHGCAGRRRRITGGIFDNNACGITTSQPHDGIGTSRTRSQ